MIKINNVYFQIIALDLCVKGIKTPSTEIFVFFTYTY